MPMCRRAGASTRTVVIRRRRGAHVRQDAVHRRPLARASRLVHHDRQARQLGADLLRRQPAGARGEDRGLEDRMATRG